MITLAHRLRLVQRLVETSAEREILTQPGTVLTSQPWHGWESLSLQKFWTHNTCKSTVLLGLSSEWNRSFSSVCATHLYSRIWASWHLWHLCPIERVLAPVHTGFPNAPPVIVIFFLMIFLDPTWDLPSSEGCTTAASVCWTKHVNCPFKGSGGCVYGPWLHYGLSLSIAQSACFLERHLHPESLWSISQESML